MAPYPTTYQIEDMFQAGESGPDGFMSYLDPKAKMTVVGHDHHLAGDFSGADSVKDNHFSEFANILDFSKPNQLEIVRVIGGGDSPWAVVEVKATAKTKTGKKFNHECAFVVRFNSAGKITTLRAYYDSKHMDGHVEDQKNGTTPS